MVDGWRAPGSLSPFLYQTDPVRRDERYMGAMHMEQDTMANPSWAESVPHDDLHNNCMQRIITPEARFRPVGTNAVRSVMLITESAAARPPI